MQMVHASRSRLLMCLLTLTFFVPTHLPTGKCEVIRDSFYFWLVVGSVYGIIFYYYAEGIMKALEVCASSCRFHVRLGGAAVLLAFLLTFVSSFRNDQNAIGR